ncbi:MAG: 4-hydroxyphenylpyruvate dioxygenase [Acidobacteria bacterium]|nr:MAG: 4-hydroxyphenylpyruvate dioxygenase [Acidobacteriota bacterium]REK00291.1 MAG: 4-hydroxyphenylpyruvate dioxygenase [Acidobacteriota bacterium]
MSQSTLTPTAPKPTSPASQASQQTEEDFCPIQGFDHVELYVGNAKQSALYYQHCFGFTVMAYRGLETGSRDVASYVLQQGKIRLVLSTALQADHPISEHVLRHGDGVKAIGLAVPDARAAFEAATSRGAEPVREPWEETDDDGTLRLAEIQAYGETVIRFVERGSYDGAFAPRFERRSDAPGEGFGFKYLDHMVGNVELGKMNQWVDFFARTMGFSQLVHFDDKAISTEYSALMSKVMQDGTGKVKFPINEPAQGRKKSQIEEYLDFYGGPGVQHLACATSNIIETVTKLRAAGVEFLDVPGTYYEQLEQRVGKIDEPIEDLARLGILVDRDEDGYLLQIFTKPIQDRPTVFFEVIERHGARGFGEGNFKALFESLEREQARRGNL